MLLEKITTEHKQYKTNVDQFQLWLTQLTERLNCCLNQESKLPVEHRIKALQVFDSCNYFCEDVVLPRSRSSVF